MVLTLTVVTRAILIPLTYRQLKGMRALQALQPQIKEIQAKYKNDKQRMQQEMMRFYQENKDRPLAVVIADFRLSYQRVLASVQSISEEALNAPFPWSKSENAVWGLIAGNTYEHYEEHGGIIRRWLEQP